MDCTYCDQPGTTADHVPPKLIFAKPRPSLITVPACARCNHTASLDDEYFRDVIALEEKAAQHPDARRIHAAVLRSLRRPKKRRYRQALLSRVLDVERISPGGLYLGKTAAYPVDLKRLTRVVERVTRGLFLHHVGRRLPLGCEVESFASSGFHRADPGTQKALLDLVEQTRSGPVHSIGDDVFCYRYAVASDQEDSSAWVFVVYRAMTFISITTGLTVHEEPENGAS